MLHVCKLFGGSAIVVTGSGASRKLLGGFANVVTGSGAFVKLFAVHLQHLQPTHVVAGSANAVHLLALWSFANVEYLEEIPSPYDWLSFLCALE